MFAPRPAASAAAAASAEEQFHQLHFPPSSVVVQVDRVVDLQPARPAVGRRRRQRPQLRARCHLAILAQRRDAHLRLVSHHFDDARRIPCVFEAVALGAVLDPVAHIESERPRLARRVRRCLPRPARRLRRRLRVRPRRLARLGRLGRHLHLLHLHLEHLRLLVGYGRRPPPPPPRPPPAPRPPPPATPPAPPPPHGGLRAGERSSMKSRLSSSAASSAAASSAAASSAAGAGTASSSPSSPSSLSLRSTYTGFGSLLLLGLGLVLCRRRFLLHCLLRLAHQILSRVRSVGVGGRRLG